MTWRVVRRDTDGHRDRRGCGEAAECGYEPPQTRMAAPR